jgi:hypothetical protein
MISKTLTGLAVIAIASTASMAAWANDFSVSLDKKTVISVQHGSTKAVPNFIHHPKSATIYSNLASAYPDGLYFSGEGDTLCGPSCAIGEQIWVGTQFTPTSTATATEVDAATGYIEGTDEVVLNIYSDASGVPGTALWSGNAKSLPTFGDCCGLATAKIKGGLSLTGGTPYWVVATTNSKDANFFGAWNLATTNQVTGVLAAGNEGSGWDAYTTTLPPAFAVYSK